MYSRVAALAVAAVLGRHAEAEGAESRRGPVTISSGTSPFVRWTCSACGAMTLAANERERVGHHLHVVVEVARSGLVGERGEELRSAELRDEGVGVGERVAFDAPGVLPAEDLGGQVVEHVGGEGAGDPRLDVALRAVVEQRPGGGDAGCGVGDVVREHLVDVGPAARGQLPHGLADHAVGEIDGVGGSGQVGSGDRLAVMPQNLPAGTRRGHLSSRSSHRALARCADGDRVRVLRIEFGCGTRVRRARPGRLGSALAAGGHRLVYGGGHVGLMGIVADAALGRAWRGHRRDDRTTRRGRDRPSWADLARDRGHDARAQGSDGGTVRWRHRAARRLRHARRGVRDPDLEPARSHRRAGRVPRRRRATSSRCSSSSTAASPPDS